MSMHRSRLSTLMIDCLDAEFEASVAFWSRALDLPVRRRPTADQRYLSLGVLPGPLFVRLQRVADDPGFHLDIETDDIRAERERMIRAGARPKARIKRWWVMEDPSGNPFCLVRPESDVLSSEGRQWDDDAAGK